MRVVLVSFVFLGSLFVALPVFAQKLPGPVRSYLNTRYRGWKLSPSTSDCAIFKRNESVSGDFNGDGKRDYAVKFTRKNKGYILAFLKAKKGFTPFVLHDTQAEEVVNLDLSVWRKGRVFEYENKKLLLRYDAPADFLCESDVGGVHYYQNGKFVGY